MAGAVGDEFDQPVMGRVPRSPQVLVEDRADHLHQLQVGALCASSDIVGLAGPAVARNKQQRVRVIFHMQPVANVVALAVDRNGFALKRVDDDHRDQFFRKLIGAVIIRAVGDDDRQAVCFAPGARQHIR